MLSHGRCEWMLRGTGYWLGLDGLLRGKSLPLMRLLA
jgi:hypothetical protein